MNPREHHFFFAKQMIPTHTFRSPDKMFAELTGPQREAFLMFLWQEVGKSVSAPMPHVDVGRRPGTNMQDVLKLDVIGAVRQGGLEVVVISMPPALAPNEAIFIALVRGGGKTRVFFYERCLGQGGAVSETEAVLSEMNPEGRVNHGFFPGDGLEQFKEQLGRVLGISLAGLENSLPPVTMAAFVAAGGGRGPAAGARARSGEIGGLLEKLLLVRAALPPFFWITGFVLGGLVGMLARVLNPVLSLAIFVLLLVWLYQIYDARRGKTAYSPGMAVGAWFIPFGNIVLPPLVVRDAWKAVRGEEGSAVVFLWWLFWLGEIGFRVLYALGFSIVTTRGAGESTVYIAGAAIPMPSAVASALGTGLSLVSLVVSIGAYGLLWHVVRRINEKA